MDRNVFAPHAAAGRVVALRKESVDRNGCLLDWDAIGYTSLSARRAWIEILSRRCFTNGSMSLSAKRAWIEIVSKSALMVFNAVALRKESVDRNGV